MEEPTQLMAVDRIVGGIEIQDQTRGGTRVLDQKGVHQEIVDLVQMGHDLLVAMRSVGADRCQLEPV